MFKSISLPYLILALLFSSCKNNEPVVLNLLSETIYPQLIKRGGKAQYSLENGILTGTAQMDTPNTFLCTPENYNNFILEYEVSIDPRLNSGVQIRSEIVQDEEYEAIKGYQVEIDPTERAWSGGIYEERDRGWIANLSANPIGKKAFRNGVWNKYHIEAIDSSIRVWVNGINTTNLLDSRYKEGLIGLQVHSISDSNYIGTMVQWRNIKLYTTELDQLKFPIGADIPEINLLVDQISDREKQEGWKLMNTEAKSCLEGTDSLNLLSSSGNFEVALEYTINKGGRAELVYGQDAQGKDLLSYAILDDAHAPKGTMNDTKAGSLMDKIEAINLSTERRDKGLRFHDQWSQVLLKCQNGKIEHWLNNDLVVTYNLDDIKELRMDHQIFLRTTTDSLCLRSVKYLKL